MYVWMYVCMYICIYNECIYIYDLYDPLITFSVPVIMWLKFPVTGWLAMVYTCLVFVVQKSSILQQLLGKATKQNANYF